MWLQTSASSCIFFISMSALLLLPVTSVDSGSGTQTIFSNVPHLATHIQRLIAAPCFLIFAYFAYYITIILGIMDN